MKPKKKRKETKEEFLEKMNKEIKQIESEGPVLVSRPDTDRILVIPFVTPGDKDYTVPVLEVFLSVLQKMKFTGYCHCFDQSLREVSHHVAGRAMPSATRKHLWLNSLA
jgi:hypothetical protein